MKINVDGSLRREREDTTGLGVNRKRRHSTEESSISFGKPFLDIFQEVC